VLSLPPAFVLSQDQTLKLNEIFVLTGHFSAPKVGALYSRRVPNTSASKEVCSLPASRRSGSAPSKRDEF
jgi:hypothetical protein